MNDKQRAKLSGVPAIYRNTFTLAYEGRSRSAAIKAFCLDCVGFERKSIRECTSHACPLYPYRPYQVSDDEQEAT
jgi:hypothetical protein